MGDFVTKCRRCACRDFRVVETYDWLGQVDDAGLLACTSPYIAIDSIRCSDCDAPYDAESFADIDFS